MVNALFEVNNIPTTIISPGDIHVEASHNVGSRNVRFDESNNVTYSDGFSKKERRDLWFRSRHYVEFKANARAVICKVQRDYRRSATEASSLLFRDTGDCELCIRGLEKFLKGNDGGNRRRHILQSIINLQRRTKNNDTLDPEAIAKLYSSMSFTDQQQAQSRGRQDEIVARKILRQFDPPSLCYPRKVDLSSSFCQSKSYTHYRETLHAIDLSCRTV